MAWLDFNIHIRNAATRQNNWLFDDVVSILLDLVEPFVNNQRNIFTHWHYLFEPDVCRGQPYCEIRLRIESDATNLNEIRSELITRLNTYAEQTGIVMRENENLGSHEGSHGSRGRTYEGARSENFGRDWDTIVEILQEGSKAALKIFRLGRSLVEVQSIEWGGRPNTYHPKYLHYPANQLFVEP